MGLTPQGGPSSVLFLVSARVARLPEAVLGLRIEDRGLPSPEGPHGGLELTGIDVARMVCVEQLEGLFKLFHLLLVNHGHVPGSYCTDVVNEGFTLTGLSNI